MTDIPHPSLNCKTWQKLQKNTLFSDLDPCPNCAMDNNFTTKIVGQKTLWDLDIAADFSFGEWEKLSLTSVKIDVFELKLIYYRSDLYAKKNY